MKINISYKLKNTRKMLIKTLFRCRGVAVCKNYFTPRSPNETLDLPQANTNIKLSSFESSENTHRRECGSYCAIWIMNPHQ